MCNDPKMHLAHTHGPVYFRITAPESALAFSLRRWKCWFVASLCACTLLAVTGAFFRTVLVGPRLCLFLFTFIICVLFRPCVCSEPGLSMRFWYVCIRGIGWKCRWCKKLSLYITNFFYFWFDIFSFSGCCFHLFTIFWE